MANSYGITVTLDSYTLGKLQAGNYSLQVFKGAKGNQSTALPTLWFSVSQFSSTVALNWTEQYGAYVDNQTVADGVVVDISSRTVDGHKANLLLKTGCKNTAGLVIFGIKNGIVEI